MRAAFENAGYKGVLCVTILFLPHPTIDDVSVSAHTP
jgi:hypothetical protein